MSRQFLSGYSPGLENPSALATQIVGWTADVKFDTFVATGLSGLMIAPVVAEMLGKNLLAVRKPRESIHSNNRLQGTLGERWVFLDDFIGGGATFERVWDAVNGYDTQFVGACLYSALSQPGFHSPEQLAENHRTVGRVLNGGVDPVSRRVPSS